MKTIMLMLFWEIVLVYSENYMKSINIFPVRTAEFINVKASGGPSNSSQFQGSAFWDMTSCNLKPYIALTVL